jgi:hypothetical protein
MPTFIWQDGRIVNKATGEPMNSGHNGGPPPCPRIIKDIAPYLSPVDGRYVSGRRAKRDDLARHNCVDAAELPSPTGGRLKSDKLIRKYGLPEHLKKEPT